MAQVSHRKERIASLIKDEAALFLEERVDETGVVVSVTHVELSPDGAEARVFISLFPATKVGTFRDKLSKLGRVFGHHIGRVLRMKKIPHVQFLFDDAYLKQERIEQLLEQDKNKKPVFLLFL